MAASKKQQRLAAKTSQAQDKQDNANTASDHESNTESSSNSILDLLTKALSGTVLDSNKGELIFEFREKMDELFDRLKKADKIEREKDRTIMQGSNQPSVSHAEMQRMIKSGVETEVAKRVGDKQIEIDRLREEVEMLKSQLPTKIDGAKKKKLKLVSEEAFDDLSMQVAGHGIQLKKLQQDSSNSKTEISRLGLCENATVQSVQDINNRLRSLDQQIASRSQAKPVEGRVGELKESICHCESQHTSHDERLVDLREDVDFLYNKMAPWTKAQFALIAEVLPRYPGFTWSSRAAKELAEKVYEETLPGRISKE